MPVFVSAGVVDGSSVMRTQFSRFSQIVVAPRLALGKIAIVNVEGLEFSYPIYAAYHRDHASTPVHQAFLKFIQHPQNRQLIEMMAQGHLI